MPVIARTNHRPSRPRSVSALATLGAVLILIGASACGGGYKPDSLHAKHRGTAQTVGCLDVAAEPLSDRIAEGPAAKLFVGNRCRGPVVVDYRVIHATMRYADGVEVAVRIFDPEQKLRPLTVDGKKHGWEAFEFHPVDPEQPIGAPTQLCLDVSQLDPEQPSLEARLICVRAENVTAVAGDGDPLADVEETK